MAYDVEYDDYQYGFRCVVIKSNRPYQTHRCGYVGVPIGHPLYGLDYSDKVDYEMPPDATIGKRGIIPLFIHAMQEDNDKKCSLDVLFDVHGGLTYAGGNDDYPVASDPQLWWFGFDTGHLDDKDDPKDLNFCIYECRNLAAQLSKFKTK